MDEDQEGRVAAIVGADVDLDLEEATKRFYEHLKQHLQLPCEVTAIEDLDWEVFYTDGPGDETEYVQLRRSQPSAQDRYDLLGIELGVTSKWMLYRGEDIAAKVRRKADGREFVLGLAELQATDHRSPSAQLLGDYVAWFTAGR